MWIGPTCLKCLLKVAWLIIKAHCSLGGILSMPLWRYTETSCLCIIRFWKVNKSFKQEKESYLETSLYNPDHKSSVSQIEETDSGHVITHYLLPERSGEDSQDSL